MVGMAGGREHGVMHRQSRYSGPCGGLQRPERDLAILAHQTGALVAPEGPGVVETGVAAAHGTIEASGVFHPAIELRRNRTDGSGGGSGVDGDDEPELALLPRMVAGLVGIEVEGLPEPRVEDCRVHGVEVRFEHGLAIDERSGPALFLEALPPSVGPTAHAP